MLKKDLANLAKRAAQVKVHTLPEPKPPSKKDKEAMAMPVHGYDERPRLYLDDKEAPFLKDWEGGKDYTLVLRVHVEDHIESSHNGDKKQYRATLIVTEIAAVPESK